MKAKKKILYITGTRADYGLMTSVLEKINSDTDFDLHLLVTGMHLQKEFGHTVDAIEKDGYKYTIINSIYKSSSKSAMAIFLGDFISKSTIEIQKIKPDLILILGDRAESLGAAVLGAYLSIPTFHFHGGEKSSTVDDLARHAITQLATFHLPATKQSAKRIIKMGQEPSRVKVVGAPGLDKILNAKYASKAEVLKELDLKDEDTILVGQHPVTLEVNDSARQIRETLEAVISKNMQVIITSPNADAGGKEMIKVIEEYKLKYPKLKVFKSINHTNYLALMKFIKVLVGNSSGGLIEAPSFKLPYVLVGTRQENRERANNVIAVGYDRNEISKAIDLALTSNFRNNIGKNPYGDGKTAKKVVKILKETEINDKLLKKELTY